MPQITILPDPSGLAQGISSAGSSLASALRMGTNIRREDQLRQQQELQRNKQNTLLMETLSSISEESSPMEVISALSKLSTQLPPEQVNSLMKLYSPMIQQTMKNESKIDLLQKLGLFPDQNGQNVTTSNLQNVMNDTPGINQTTQGILPISNWSEDKLVLATASGIPELANIAAAELKKRQFDYKKFSEERKFQTKKTEEGEKKVNQLREILPKKRMALDMAKSAVDSGEVGAFSLPNLAERLGIPELQTAKGAQLVLAGKENLLSNLGRLSARAQNLWIEKRLSEMFPQVGRTKEANMTFAEMLNAELEMDSSYLEAYDQLSEQDEKQFGYVKGDVEKRARKIADQKNEEIFKRMNYRLRQIYEDEKGTSWLMKNSLKQVPKGTYLTENMASILLEKYKGDTKKVLNNAKKLGYIIPNKNEVLSWQ